MPLEPQSIVDEIRTPAPREVDRSNINTGIISYFLILSLAGGLGAPSGIAAIPIGYFLKDNLHLSPVDLAIFVAVTGAPAYISFLPGFFRDRYRPRAMGDRAYLLIGATIALAAYAYLAVAAIEYSNLLFATLIAGVAYLIVLTAGQALMTGVAQARQMTGRLSVVAGVGTYMPAVLSALLGGWLVAHVPARITFIVAAMVTAVIALQAFWRQAAVIAFEQAQS